MSSKHLKLALAYLFVLALTCVASHAAASTASTDTGLHADIRQYEILTRRVHAKHATAADSAALKAAREKLALRIAGANASAPGPGLGLQSEITHSRDQPRHALVIRTHAYDAHDRVPPGLGAAGRGQLSLGRGAWGHLWGQARIFNPTTTIFIWT